MDYTKSTLSKQEEELSRSDNDIMPPPSPYFRYLHPKSLFKILLLI